MRGAPIIKLLKAVDLLAKPSGTTIKEMADKLNVTTRTVYRTLEVIQDLGFPVCKDDSSLEKIRNLLLPSHKFAKNYSNKEEIIDTLTKAMLQTKSCHIQYHAFHDDKIKAYFIHPLHFFENNRGIYLFIKVGSFNDIRIIAVERIISIRETDDFFEYPKDFNPAELIDNAFNYDL